MDLYLPIANLSVNALVIVFFGFGVGLLSGMFGVGGGFLTTPLLIVYGIPPTVALPIGGRPVRASLDWRQRIAGDARPGSGLVLTLGTDF